MKYRIELRHIRYFQAVAEELHYKKAADKLFISQPGLSRQIKHLEEEIGSILFKRHNRKVQLTPAGKHLYHHSKNWSTELEEILVRTHEISTGIETTLRLGYVGSAMQSVIPKLLDEFKTNKPEIKFALNELDNSSQIQKLLHSQIDLGFVRLNKVPAPLQMKTILNEHFCLVLPINYELKKNNLNSLAMLEKESFILFEKEYSPTYYEEVMSLFRDAGFSPIVSHSSVNALTIFKMVENGFGLAVVPQSLKSNFNMKIKFIDLDHFPQRTNLNLVWNKADESSALQDVFSSLHL